MLNLIMIGLPSNNGSLNIKTMEFINLEDIDPNTTIIARKFLINLLIQITLKHHY